MAHFKALNPPETVEVNKKTTFVSAVPAKVVFEYKNFLIQRLDDHQNRKRRIGQIAMSTAADLFFISVPVQQIKIYNNIVTVIFLSRLNIFFANTRQSAFGTFAAKNSKVDDLA